MKLNVVTVLVRPEAGGSSVGVVGTVWWGFGLYSTAVFACWTGHCHTGCSHRKIK